MRRLGAVARPVGAAPLRIVDVGTGSGAIAVALAVSLRRLRALEAVDDRGDGHLRRTRSGSPGRTRSATRWRTGSRSRRRTCCPTTRRGRSISSSPTCRTCGRDVIAGLPRATSFEPVVALDGGVDGLEVIGRLLDRLPDVARRRRGRARSRSARTRATRSWRWSRARLPGWDLPRRARPGRAAAGRPDRPARRRAGRRQRLSRRSGIISRVPIVTPGPHPAHRSGRPRHRRHARGRRPRHRSGHPGGHPRGARARRHRHASSPAGWSRARSASRASWTSTRRSSATRARSSARCRRRRRRGPGGSSSTPRCRAAVAREVVVWARAQGLDPHVNHLERFIVRSDDPRADEYTTFMGSPARISRTTWSARSAIRSPRSCARGEPPLPTERRAAGPDPLRRAGRRDGEPPALHRVRGAGRVEGSSGPLARAPARRPARRGPGDRRPVERHRDARRGRPRDRDADRAGARSGRSPATSPRRWPRRASPG